MNMCLKMLFTLSLSGTALILVLLGATRIFGSHMGRRWQYYIWLAAVLRLLLPIPSPAGLIFPDALSSGMSAGLLSDGGESLCLDGWTFRQRKSCGTAGIGYGSASGNGDGEIGGNMRYGGDGFHGGRYRKS